MSTPEGDYETAVDDSNDRDAREAAIDELETANECDMLVDLVRMDDLERSLRERALENLATPQCKQTMENVVEDGDLDESLREQAETLLEDVPDDPMP